VVPRVTVSFYAGDRLWAIADRVLSWETSLRLQAGWDSVQPTPVPWALSPWKATLPPLYLLWRVASGNMIGSLGFPEQLVWTVVQNG
jgi:hypothetical protein